MGVRAGDARGRAVDVALGFLTSRMLTFHRRPPREMTQKSAAARWRVARRGRTGGAVAAESLRLVGHFHLLFVVVSIVIGVLVLVLFPVVVFVQPSAGLAE